jgi:hypothetical protein
VAVYRQLVLIMVLSVEPLGNGTGFKDKRKNQIFQFIGQTSENPGTKLLT